MSRRFLRFKLVRNLALIPLTLVLLAACSSGAAAQDCTAPSSWFPHSSTPEPNFNQAFTTNCDFHKWSFQEFLYLTQHAGGGLARFETMADPKGLFLASTPAAYPPPLPPLPPHCKTGKPIAQGTGLVLASKGATVDQDFHSIFQAGTTEILIDQASQVVYATAHVNKDYYDFVVHGTYYTLAGIKAASSTIDFPVGALETKSTWRVAETDGKTYIEDASKFYTINAYIQRPKAKQDSTKKQAQLESCVVDATLALTGLHAVGRVKGHPEFIWSTFEHVDNAPDCSATPAKGGPWSFYKAGTACTPKSFPTNCNQGKSTLPNTPPPYTPTEVCRVSPWGNGTAQNENNIQSLNKSVKKQLASDSVWQNYQYIGAIWTNGKIPPKGTQNGSTKLANTSAETFSQELNCFGCHTSFPPNPSPLNPAFNCLKNTGQKNLYVSHLFGLICFRPN